jgi:hypothetical protein
MKKLSQEKAGTVHQDNRIIFRHLNRRKGLLSNKMEECPQNQFRDHHAITSTTGSECKNLKDRVIERPLGQRGIYKGSLLPDVGLH